MNTKASILLMALAASVAVAGCANQSEIKPEPVIVHVADAESLADPSEASAAELWRATHVKFGARWFPRCQDKSSLNTRLSRGQYACLTDDEVKEVAAKGTNLVNEFSQRSQACSGPCVPGGN